MIIIIHIDIPDEKEGSFKRTINGKRISAQRVEMIKNVNDDCGRILLFGHFHFFIIIFIEEENSLFTSKKSMNNRILVCGIKHRSLFTLFETKGGQIEHV